MSLTILIPANEDAWDEARQKFVSIKETKLVLEHSLVSLSKWESKWKVPFLADNRKMTNEELIDYIRCMTINANNVDPNVYRFLTNNDIKRINDYINDPMTATTFTNRDPQQNSKKEVLTSEVIYYLMTANNIPVEFQKWHLNRLLTLLKVCAIKNAPPKNMSKRDTISNYAAMNAARKAKYHTKG